MKYEITLTHNCVKFPLPAVMTKENMYAALNGNFEYYDIDAVCNINNREVVVTNYDNDFQMQNKVVQAIYELLDEIDEELQVMKSFVDDRTLEEVVTEINGNVVQKHISQEIGTVYAVESKLFDEPEIVAVSSVLKNAVEIAETLGGNA